MLSISVDQEATMDDSDDSEEEQEVQSGDSTNPPASYAAVASSNKKTVRFNPISQVKPASRKALASVFTKSMARTHCLFVKIMFPSKASPKDPASACRAQLIEYFQMLISIYDSAILYKWDKEADLEADACLKPTALPTSLTGLQSYANQLKPTPEAGDCWCNL